MCRLCSPSADPALQQCETDGQFLCSCTTCLRTAPIWSIVSSQALRLSRHLDPPTPPPLTTFVPDETDRQLFAQLHHVFADGSYLGSEGSQAVRGTEGHALHDWHHSPGTLPLTAHVPAETDRHPLRSCTMCSLMGPTWLARALSTLVASSTQSFRSHTTPSSQPANLSSSYAGAPASCAGLEGSLTACRGWHAVHLRMPCQSADEFMLHHCLTNGMLMRSSCTAQHWNG